MRAKMRSWLPLLYLAGLSYSEPAVPSAWMLSGRRCASICVFKDGVGYDPNKLLDSVKGRYGEY